MIGSHFIGTVIGATLLVGLGSGAVNAQSACETYIVKKKDTLGTISDAAYGTNKKWRQIYNANRDVIGFDPNVIELGTVLRIPCADGSLPERSAVRVVEPESVVRPATPESRPATPDPRPRYTVLGVGDLPPYSDEDLPGRGLFTELVTAAMEAATDQVVSISFVDDLDMHLDVLLPNNAFDMGFPWFKPNCDRLAGASELTTERCTNFLYSQAVVETTSDIFATSGSQFLGASDHTALRSARICRPDGYQTFDIEEEGLAVSVTPPNMRACFVGLTRGAVDVVWAERRIAEKAIEDLDLADAVARNPQLSKPLSMHVVVPRSSPYAESDLDLIDRGLTEIRRSGVWFAIVSTRLAEPENQ